MLDGAPVEPKVPLDGALEPPNVKVDEAAVVAVVVLVALNEKVELVGWDGLLLVPPNWKIPLCPAGCEPPNIPGLAELVVVVEGALPPNMDPVDVAAPVEPNAGAVDPEDCWPNPDAPELALKENVLDEVV